MNAPELTALLGSGGGLIVAFGTYYGTVRSSRTAAAASTVSTWKDLSAERKIERDEARADLAEIDAKYRTRMREMETDYQAQLAALRARITQLEADLAAMAAAQGSGGHGWPLP